MLEISKKDGVFIAFFEGGIIEHDTELPTLLRTLISRAGEIKDKFKDSAEPDVIDTLEKAVEYMMPKFEGMETNYYFGQGEESFASYCHSQVSGGIGMMIRNELCLWDDKTPLHQHFKTEHDCQHPDDMSNLIIINVYRKMKLR